MCEIVCIAVFYYKLGSIKMAKRYYWLKLKDDFFTDKRIKKLRRIAGGDTYTIIYLKMMMKCMNNDGILEYDGIEDSFADELALDLDEDADNVQITVNFLMQAGLLEEMGENHFLMTEVPELVGSETASAQRVRDFRNKQKALQCNTDVTEVKQLCSVEKEKDKDKEIDKEKIREDKIKHTYGEYKHVRLTDIEYTKLCDEYGDIKAGECITYLDEYIEMKGYKAKNHYLCIRKWVANAVDEHKGKNNQRSANKVADKLNESYDLINQWVHEREVQ
jgi:predicted phage replisome organizer